MGQHSAVTGPFSRVGFRVLDDAGCPVGVVVHDSRGLHGAACRQCWGAVFDQSSWTLTARWLGHHLADTHDVHGLVLDTGRLRRDRQLVRIVAEATAVWAARGAAA